MILPVGRRLVVAAVVGLTGTLFGALQLRHGVIPALDTASYWSGVNAFRAGHPLTTTLAASFSDFDVLQVLRHGGRLPFVDFPIGYPLLAGVLGVAIGARTAMITVTVLATGGMVFVGVFGPRSRPVSSSALVLRSLLMLGIVALPVFRLTTQATLSEPLFCFAALWFVASLVEYRDEARTWWVPALLVAACGLFRFVGASLVVLLVAEMWRRRDGVRRIGAASAVAIGPVLANMIWVSAVGGGHRVGWRGLDGHDADIAARSIGGWFNARLGDLRVTYFGPDRSAAGWVWLLALAWSLVVALAMFRPLVPPRSRVSEEAMVCLRAAGVLFVGLVVGMVGFDSLVIADNRLMLPMGVLTVAAAAWSLRVVEVKLAWVVGVAVCGWLSLATGWSNWTESFTTPVRGVAIDPAVLPNGHRVAVVLSNDADSLHWASGVAAAYLPFAVNSLTGEAVDTKRLWDELPCALRAHNGMILITQSRFGSGDVDALANLVGQGRLRAVPSRLGAAYVAAESCDG